MVTRNRIVSVGFLTEGDMRRLGSTFTRHIPVPDDGIFDDLLRELDKIEIEPLGSSMVLRPTAKD